MAKLIDWSVLQLTSLRKPPFSGQDLGLEEALQFIKGPDFVPAKSEPAQVEFNGSLRPLIPRQNVLLIEAIHDMLAEPTEELWCQWGQPEIWRVPHGHFSFSLIGAPCLMARRVFRWLGPRLHTAATL